MQSRDQVTEQVREAVLGIIKEISEILKKAPETIDQQIKQLYQLRELVTKCKAQAVMLTGENADTDKSLSKNLAEALDKTIQPYIKQNNDLKQQALKGLQAISEQIKPSRPRM